MPDERHLVRWIERLKALGFAGVMFEYEDRLPWSSFPGVHRPGLQLDAWQRIWQTCRDCDLPVIPCVPTLGHMEWLLRREPYADWREGASIREVCPSNPVVLQGLLRWIDEVIDLHPSSAMVMIGGDETLDLGKCPQCSVTARESPEGKLALLIGHVRRLAERVLARGRRPMIWADMFGRHDQFQLANQLPVETVLVDWQYYSGGPFPSVDKLKLSGREVWGASAIRCMYDTNFTLGNLQARIENVDAWNKVLQSGGVSCLVHTTWGRSRSLMPMYGPWEGYWPAFLAAADQMEQTPGPLIEGLKFMDDAGSGVLAPGKALKEIERLASTSELDEWAASALRWWQLTLKHRVLLAEFQTLLLRPRAIEAAGHFVGRDEPVIREICGRRSGWHQQTLAWEAQVRAFFAERGLSDVEEFIATRTGYLRDLLPHSNEIEA